MKKTGSMILMMVLLQALHSTTFAQSPHALKGTWVVDMKATEGLLKNSPPSSQDLQWISVSSGLMFQMIYEFTDSAIAVSAYTLEKKLMYQLLPRQDNKLRYVSEVKQAGRDDILIVNIISDENISISSSQSPATKYFLLKRVKLDPTMRAEDGKRAFEAWKVWAPDIASILAPKTTDLEEGLFAFEKGEYDVAFGKLNPLAEAGVAMAQNIVGRMYLRGQGVPLDYNQALLLFRKAASLGLPNAQNNLGVMYAAGQGVQQDYKQAIFWFREAANQGYALAMNGLADMYMKGLGVDPDKAEAYRWRAKARSAGFSGKKDIVVIKTVGNDEYRKGLESYYRWEFTEAATLFVAAAKKGHPEAQLILGIMYKHGQGVLKDETQARYWIQRAKDQGHAPDDTRDRVLIFDSSAENSNAIE
ncbi:MAG: sel1 repeat family protein [Nitrospiraceae bacterium]|jgi:TPR repeat protein|nr:sel1 repeat family protein [Nitrospiraceae bacterium]